MKYIIMCGGDYKKWSIPRQLMEINGEPIIARTIRLLKECGIEDIAISSNYDIFKQFNVPVLHHDNKWTVYGTNNSQGHWANGFYPTDLPVCYLFGDVVFSKKAIKKIVQTETKDIDFFASAPPFDKDYIKIWAEPFAFKVINTKYFWNCINTFKKYKEENKFIRDPMSWELWQIIKNTPLNKIDYTNYIIINDYTCDVDNIKDVAKMCKILERKVD